MEARMRRDFEAVDRSEAAAAMAQARYWERVAMEAAEGRERYRGVRKVPSGRYVAGAQDPDTRKMVWLGTYETAFVAACSYDISARGMQGHKAKPNFFYPPPPSLVAAVAATPRRRGHSYRATAAQARLGLRAPASAPAPGTGITLLRSIPPGSFSFKATAAASRRVYDPVNLFWPQMHMVAPPSPAKTCFSSTVDPKLRDNASSSSSRRRLMLKKPKVTAVPSTTTTTTSTNADCEFTDDNFNGVAVPSLFTAPSSARMPIDLNAAP